MNKPAFYRNNNFFRKLYLLMVFCVIISGCDIFNTRNAEQPTQPKSDFEPAATVDILIKNFINSLADKDVTNYIACLSDTSFTDRKFEFIPSSEAVSTYPTLIDWDKRNEEQYFTNMVIKVNSNSKINLTLNEISRNISSVDTVVYTASYSLNLPIVNSNSEVIPQIYEGTLTFRLVRDSRAVWSIYYWQDIKSASANLSWSDLKGNLAN